MDGVNSIVFKALDEDNTIAVTTTWYYSRGINKGLAVEFDMAFNTNFAWTNDGTAEVEKMDVWNITTHEAGHALGLDHSSSSTDLTMYPFATEGETKKRDLAPGDVAGITARYP
jgi:predicted Zn-dependent protease